MQRATDLLNRIVGRREDESERRRMMFLAGLSLLMMGTAPIIGGADVLMGSMVGWITMGAFTTIGGTTIWLVHTGRTTLATWFFMIIQLIAGNAANLSHGGVSHTTFAVNALIIMCAGLLLDRGGLFAIWMGTVVPWLAAPLTEPPFFFEAAFWAAILGTLGIMLYGVVSLTEASIQTAAVERTRAQTALATLETTSVSHDTLSQLLGALREYIVVTGPDHTIRSLALSDRSAVGRSPSSSADLSAPSSTTSTSNLRSALARSGCTGATAPGFRWWSASAP